MIKLPPSFNSIDRHFADLLCRKSQINDAEVARIFALLSQTLGQQNSCLPITESRQLDTLSDLDCITVVPLEDSFAVTSISTPLVLLRDAKSGYLYTNRFFACESRIARNLILRNETNQNLQSNVRELQNLLQPEDDLLQIRAAVQAVSRRLTIITGGPGTGKTSTVVKIIAALSNATPELRISLGAPTGKAAMRLSESIQATATRLNLSVATEVSTIHRLLGMRGDGQTFTYHAQRQLPIDALVLDEASMIDLVMFDRILSALPDTCQLILLGDPYQLPSVESGSVLSDITSHGVCYTDDFRAQLSRIADIRLPGRHDDHPLANSHCALEKSFRFKDDSGIGQLARLLKTNNQTEVTQLDDEVSVYRHFDQATLIKQMTDLYEPFLQACRNPEVDAEQLLQLFDTARLLTPIRDGEYGVTSLNKTFETSHFPDTDSYYHGKPLMIERNHYALRLFNGDVGICVQRGDSLEVAFRKPSGEIEFYLPSRLPQHDTCYAMTVHKSQGSEFDRVCLVLPETQQDNFISRELIYTGITRCRSQLSIYSEHDMLNAVQDTRVSALAVRLTPGSKSRGAQLNLFSIS